MSQRLAKREVRENPSMKSIQHTDTGSEIKMKDSSRSQGQSPADSQQGKEDLCPTTVSN